jgi:hypothetical protein
MCSPNVVDADSGLDAVHRILDEASSHHEALYGLQRLKPGSHGIWQQHCHQIMLYKLVDAAMACGLTIRIFHLDQKAK